MRAPLRRLTLFIAIGASALRRWWAVARFSNIEFGKGVHVARGVHFQTTDGGKISVGAGTLICPNVTLAAKGGVLRIGSNSLVNVGATIIATCEILIGKDALIAEYVTIRDHDHAYGNQEMSFTNQGRVNGRIDIGENVWIGAKVTITKGVHIHPRTIIGANSVVTKSLERPGIFVGVPVRKIKDL